MTLSESAADAYAMVGQQSENGGTGTRFATAVTILAGVSALVATLVTIV